MARPPVTPPGSGAPFIRLPCLPSGMDVREAVEADAQRLGELADGPTDVMRNLIHDRTVRVAVERRGEADDGGDGHAEPAAGSDGVEEDEEVVGFVSFDAREGVVYVTQLAGTRKACERLIAEPIGFAEGEGMAVELLVPAGEEAVRHAVEAAGFTETGSGPQFAGTETTRYRREATPRTR